MESIVVVLETNLLCTPRIINGKMVFIICRCIWCRFSRKAIIFRLYFACRKEDYDTRNVIVLCDYVDMIYNICIIALKVHFKVVLFLCSSGTKILLIKFSIVLPPRISFINDFLQKMVPLFIRHKCVV